MLGAKILALEHLIALRLPGGEEVQTSSDGETTWRERPHGERDTQQDCSCSSPSAALAPAAVSLQPPEGPQTRIFPRVPKFLMIEMGRGNKMIVVDLSHEALGWFIMQQWLMGML